MGPQAICLACVSIEGRARPEFLAMAALCLCRQAATTMSKIDSVLHSSRPVLRLGVVLQSCVSKTVSCRANMFYLLLMFFMPGPGVPIGTALACASKTIPTALVLVEILVTNLLLFAVRTPLVGDTFNFNQGFAARFDSLWGSRLGWSV